MKNKVKEEKSLFIRTEAFFESKSRWVIIISLALSFLVTMLLFNRDVSVGGDDSGYIKFAYEFAKGKSFPAWHSPFYSIILSLPILLFGVNISLLNFTSVLFNLGAIYFTYQFFKKYTNYTIATVVTAITSVNYLICYYASTTYSESFFFLFQILFLYYFIEVSLKSGNDKETFQRNWKHFAVLGVLGYLFFLTKTVAIAAVGVSVVYLLIRKQYKNSAVFLSAAAISHFLLSFLKKVIWHSQKVGFEDQLESLLLKNPYKISLGKENFAGFLQRFWDNSGLYFSKHFMKMLGIFPADFTKTNVAITLTVYALLIGSAVLLIIKNKKLIHAILSIAAMIGATFFILQKMWDQDRLIMIYFPFMIGFIGFAFYKLLDSPKRRNLQFFFIFIFGLIFLLNINQSIKQIEKKRVQQSMAMGDFNSYTPDWQNYMLACQWAGRNLPSDAVVLCRKPDMSWIASNGKDIFNGIFRIEYQNADSIYNMVKEKKATHVILENFRMNPKKKTKRTITTIRHTLAYLTLKEPGCLKLVKEFGSDEKAYIFEIDLNTPRFSDQYFNNLESAIIINPQNVNAYIEKAQYLKKQKRLTDALALYEKGISLVPDEPFLYFNRGLLIFETGNYAQALADFKKATDLKPDFNQAWYNQSISYYYLNDLTNAQKALEKAKSTGMKGYEQFENRLYSRR